MGIENNRDREAIWRKIVKQRLKTDMMEIRDLEFMNIYYEWKKIDTNLFCFLYFSFFISIVFGAVVRNFGKFQLADKTKLNFCPSGDIIRWLITTAAHTSKSIQIKN